MSHHERYTSRNPRRKPGGHRSFILDDGYPTKNILLARNPPNLTGNKVIGSYKSVSEYLDTHFDLLLEDFVCPLREALRKFKQNTRTRTLNGARVYHKVKLSSINLRNLHQHQEITCSMNIDTSQGCIEPPAFGCLLVFTRQNFNEDFFLGTVIADTTKTGTSSVELKLKLPRDCQLDPRTLKDHNFIVIESEAFFYVYFHVLKALNTFDEHNFPMKQYIVYGDKATGVQHPAYLSTTTKYKVLDHENVPVLNDDKWPSAEALGVDNESHYAALKKALTEEIALVQGPPGTGKTYFGVSMVKVLLQNVEVWNPSGRTPLLVVCQSNQALDHFLEKLLPFTSQIVRIGDQSQSQLLQPLSLKELVCRRASEVTVVHGLKSHVESLDKAREQVKQFTHGIVNFKTLEKFGIIDEKISKVFASEETYLEWLGLLIKAEKKSINESDCDVIVSAEKLLQRVHQLELVGDYLLAIHLKKELSKVQKLISCFEERCYQEVSWNVKTLLSLSSEDAQNVYLCWCDKLFDQLQSKVECLEDSFDTFWENIPRVARQILTMRVLRSSHVVGLTSTGAASRHHILEELRSPIVIIEEAGEILESHVIVSMTMHCQHLVMMGDHKQLKPGVTTHHLARDFNLNISLFERLLRNEIVKGTCLTTQYRMKPEISVLLKPHIYKILYDAPETKRRPAVRGVSKSVFFLDHEERELKNQDNTGCWNPHEVIMLINLAKYLVSMGYASTDITIIAMYSEQKNKFIEERDKNPDLTNLQIASVDSFQGKENEIILLSLVRSNKTGNIGFLKEENRVCVALSRARIGLFIVGDMKCLTRGSKMWYHVSKRLKNQGAIGKKFTLSCDKHKTVHFVEKSYEWNPQFCYWCSLEAVRKNFVDISIKPIVAVADFKKSTGTANNTRCSCCQSFYCDKVRADTELSAMFGKLTVTG